MLTSIPHKWAKEIKAWADGAEIEVRTLVRHCNKNGDYDEWGHWHITREPVWCTATTYEYRVKPEVKPDIVLYGCSEWIKINGRLKRHDSDTVAFTIDGETSAIKKVDLL